MANWKRSEIINSDTGEQSYVIEKKTNDGVDVIFPDEFAEEYNKLETALEEIMIFLAGPNGLDVPPDYKYGGEYIWNVAAKAIRPDLVIHEKASS